MSKAIFKCHLVSGRKARIDPYASRFQIILRMMSLRIVQLQNNPSGMLATVSVTDIPVWCIIGLTEEQRRTEQCIIIDISVIADIGPCCTDQPATKDSQDRMDPKPLQARTSLAGSSTGTTRRDEKMSVDTKVLAEIARNVPVCGKYQLIETAVHDIAMRVLKVYGIIEEVSVRLRKKNIYAPTEITLKLRRSQISKL
jgi:dihydroneopterin aldolase